MNRNTNVMLKLCMVFLMGTAGFFVSCQNELNTPVETFAPHEHPLSFTATIGVSTRASVDNNFEEFDYIMIQTVDFYTYSFYGLLLIGSAQTNASSYAPGIMVTSKKNGGSICLQPQLLCKCLPLKMKKRIIYKAISSMPGRRQPIQ